jgi:hypothetical protein
LREEHRLRVFENMVMRKILGSKKRRQENGEDHITRSFMTCTPQQILFGGDQIKKNEMGRECCTYERQERCIQGFDGETRWK